MRTILNILKAFPALLFVIVAAGSCKGPGSPAGYLEIVLNRLDGIQSASYFEQAENWNPGDTAPSHTSLSYLKEYDYPADSTIGAKFVRLDASDTARMEFCYDGTMRALVYPENGTVVLDSFTLRPLPFRPLTPPFFNYVKSILAYVLETTDSITLDFRDMKDSVYLKLTIFEEQQVEFFGKPFHMPPDPYGYGDNTSVYEVWIDKASDLPYKVRREMSHNSSVLTCKNPKLNQIDIVDFRATDYFPAGYEIHGYRIGGGKGKPHELLGKQAPDWVLTTSEGDTVRLKDLTSRVLLIQFTSVSCGPCRASIPFLRQLSKEYPDLDFQLVAIECTSINATVLNTYKTKNHFEYPFLLSPREVSKSYSVSSFPVFFLLDERRVIRKVVNGYGEGTTDREIRKAIGELI